MTDIEHRICDFIEAYRLENWTSPSVAEIAAEVGHSKSTIHYYLMKLVRLGILERKELDYHRVVYRVNPNVWPA